MIAESIEKLSNVQSSENPFPGLRPFELHESHLFFGREGQSEKLLAKLEAARFLAVVGTSGSGKSSLVRAGLAPALFGGMMVSAGSNWRVTLMRPSNDPIGNLARTLSSPEVFGSDIVENAEIQARVAEATLRRGNLGLVEAVRLALQTADENLLVVVDQFEELFRFARAARSTRYENDAAAFIKLLLEPSRQYQLEQEELRRKLQDIEGSLRQQKLDHEEARQEEALAREEARKRDVRIYVVLTMRSDFLGDCAKFWDLPEAVNESQYLIPRLTRDQLREAIAGPVAVGGGQIAPRLVNQLLNDIGDNQDQLPILQHALMRTWDNWSAEYGIRNAESRTPTTPHSALRTPQLIDLPHYEAIGTMVEALSRHADEAYHELDEPQQQIAEKMFKALTEKGEDNREIRRPVMLGELCAVTGATAGEVIAVIETFRAPGRSFLMPPANVALNSESLIDISHESLIRGWERLKNWVAEEARSARIYRRLAETAELHREGKAGLWGDPDLQLALDWREQQQPNLTWARRYHPEFDRAMDFLNESQRVRDTEIKEKERKRKRAFLITTALGVIFLTLSIFALRQTKKAERLLVQANQAQANADSAQRVANAAQKEANSAQDKMIVAESQIAKEKEQTTTALIAAEAEKVKAQGISQEAERQRAFANQQRAIVESQDRATPHFRAIMRGSADTVISAAFNPDGAQVVTASADGAARVWDVSTGNNKAVLGGHQGKVLRAAFSRDGRWIATASADKTARVWDARTGQSRLELIGHTGLVSNAVFSSDGRFIATASDDKTVRVWDAKTGQRRLELGKFRKLVSSVAYSPDSRYIVTTSLETTARVWDAITGESVVNLVGHTQDVGSATYSPDGRFIVTASFDKNALVWDARTGQLILQLIGHVGPVSYAIFSPDGKFILTASDDNTAIVWNAKNGDRMHTLRGVTGLACSVAFSPNSEYVVTANLDKTARVWKTNTGNLYRELRGHTSPVTSVEFSSDGKLVLTSGDLTARVWEAATGFDFVALAPEAHWSSATPGSPLEPLKFPGEDIDPNGFALWREVFRMEDGSILSEKALEMHPKWVDEGNILGFYPTYTVQLGDHFKAKFGFLYGGQRGDVKIQLKYKEASEVRLLQSWAKAYDGSLITLDVDLSAIVGHSVQFVLVVLANGPSTQDWAIWVSPRIER